MSGESHPQVLILGGGFGGLYAAKALGRVPVNVTLIDRRNFHLFQPLLYQVATGALSPGEIASPLRVVLRRHKNTRVWMAEATGIDPAGRKVILKDGEVSYDFLIVATGSQNHYFGHPEWATLAPGLKSIEDATEIRRRILLAFEAAEREPDPAKREAWLRFVIIGGGPTGVELAGALGEIAKDTLRNDFRSIDPKQAQILLIEGAERVLNSFPADLSAKAEAALVRLGARPLRGMVTEIDSEGVTVQSGDQQRRIKTRTVLWAAGVQPSRLAKLLAASTGAELDRSGRIVVSPDLTIPGHPEIFVIGDMANCSHQFGHPLPGLAPVAMQQGRYAASVIEQRLKAKPSLPFRYRDKGNLATIGRAAAVADIFGLHISGWIAWVTWLFVHLMYLVEFDNRVLVLFNWAYDYVTYNRGARLITGRDSSG